MIELIAAAGLAKCLFGLAAVIGATSGLVTAVQAARKKKAALEPETKTDKLMDRLSMLPRGALRRNDGKSP
jgi:hypothetical protein